MTSVNPINLDTLHLDSGAHNNPTEGHCLLEVVSMFAAEPFGDSPQCVSPFLRGYGIRLNDIATDERRQQLKRFIPLLPGTAGDGLDERRRWLATDHAVRVSCPKWLDRAGLSEHAETLRALTPVTDAESYRAAREAVSAVRDVTWKLRLDRRQKIRDAVTKAVQEKLASRPVAVAAAAAAAVADAAAAADADAAADPWGATYTAVKKAVYTKIRAVYEERFGDLARESWDDAADLFDRLITIGGVSS